VPTTTDTTTNDQNINTNQNQITDQQHQDALNSQFSLANYMANSSNQLRTNQ
jgi:hypothetical protein